MAHCPKCQSEIHEDFGVVTCQACGATLIIDLDGEVRDFQEEPSLQHKSESETILSETNSESNMLESSLSVPDMSESSPEEDHAHPHVQSSLDESSSDFCLESDAPLFSSEGLSLSEDNAGDDDNQNSDDGENQEDQVTDSFDDSMLNFGEYSLGEGSIEGTHQEIQASEVESGVESEVGSAIEEFDQWAETVNEDLHTEGGAKGVFSEGEEDSSSTEHVLSEVKEFGNSEISSAENGIFLYTLRLDGIDSGEVKSHLLHVLKDPRLKMDAENILNGLKNGHITIRKINAVKAFVIVNAVKSLPIDIFWEQHDITI